jgi:glycosyltransferase involved in cell wall biosynthesis
MKILFLTLAKINSIEDNAIYPDLLRKFRNEGHSIVIVCPLERKYNKSTELISEKGCEILKVWTTNIQKTNFFEKTIGILLIEFLFKKAFDKYFNNEKFDLILYSTPPITFTRLIRNIKNRTSAVTYLLLKDIFPQNAVDLKIIKKNSIVYRYFRNIEKELYNLSDYIGCMSEANVQYILKNNPNLNNSKIEVNPNSILIEQNRYKFNFDNKINSGINLPEEKTIFVYGGNLGKPQGLDFLLKIMFEKLNDPNVYFVVVGSGTEYKFIYDWFKLNQPTNAILLTELNQKEYNILLSKCHVGLVFLHPDFTIPNYPSRILNYMENKLPILFATDVCTDIGPEAENYGYGFWCENGDLNKFISYINYCVDNKEILTVMGERGYVRLIKEFNVDNSYSLILNRLKNI